LFGVPASAGLCDPPNQPPEGGTPNKHFLECYSSALAPLCCQQLDSAALRQVLRQKPRIVAWWSAIIEAHSALARLLREGTLTPRATLMR